MFKRSHEGSKLVLRVPIIEWRRLPLVMLPVAGGLALVMHILTRTSLPVVYGVLALAGACAWWALLRTADQPIRARLLRRVRSGLLAGLVATLAYDACRYGVVAVLSLSIEPFHVWSLFGQALIGPDVSPTAAFATGTAYHVINGIGFGIAFTLLVRSPTVWRGVVWGLGLELAMALLYPSWLRLVQLQEFMTMSVLGHVVYGATLGITAATMLRTHDADLPAEPGTADRSDVGSRS